MSWLVIESHLLYRLVGLDTAGSTAPAVHSGNFSDQGTCQDMWRSCLWRLKCTGCSGLHCNRADIVAT